MAETKLVERLSNLEHRRWSRWMTYLFSKCELQVDGSMLIPVDSVHHWQRQINTDYQDLTEEEKESDRKEAHKAIEILTKYLCVGE